MHNGYSPKDLHKHRDWVADHGGDLFPTLGAFEWFVRQRREELIESGELIIRRGPGGTLVGPNFGRLAVEIIQRESRQLAGGADFLPQVLTVSRETTD